MTSDNSTLSVEQTTASLFLALGVDGREEMGVLPPERESLQDILSRCDDSTWLYARWSIINERLTRLASKMGL